MDFHTPPPRRNYKDYSPAGQPAHLQPAVQPPPNVPKRKRRAPSKKLWRTLAILVLIILIAGLSYEYIHTRNQLESAKNPGGTAGQSESQKLQNQVSKLAALPAGETPTIATVNDASKLKTQAFFANAKNGDKVLIFAKSGKAVLYRPSTNQIVEYSTVNLSAGTGQ